MKSVVYLVACAGLIASCATSLPPAELITARETYRHATSNPAVYLVPEELYKARKALAAAEEAFQYAPQSYRTRDLAYIADRKARTAEALATAAIEDARIVDADRDTQQIRSESSEKVNVNSRMAETNAQNTGLVQPVGATEGVRGLIITMSDSLLFASAGSVLLPAARNRLNQVADVLMTTKERNVVVESHSDSQELFNENPELSQSRADAVRSYLVLRGYPRDKIQALGIGSVAGEKGPGGEASNGRIEIIAERHAK